MNRITKYGLVGLGVLGLTFGAQAQQQDCYKYKVREGDTLSQIAEKNDGNPMHWEYIYKEYNPDIEDPHLIKEGQTINVPFPSVIEKKIKQERPEAKFPAPFLKSIDGKFDEVIRNQRRIIVAINNLPYALDHANEVNKWYAYHNRKEGVSIDKLTFSLIYNPKIEGPDHKMPELILQGTFGKKYQQGLAKEHSGTAFKFRHGRNAVARSEFRLFRNLLSSGIFYLDLTGSVGAMNTSFRDNSLRLDGFGTAGFSGGVSHDEVKIRITGGQKFNYYWVSGKEDDNGPDRWEMDYWVKLPWKLVGFGEWFFAGKDFEMLKLTYGIGADLGKFGVGYEYGHEANQWGRSASNNPIHSAKVWLNL